MPATGPPAVSNSAPSQASSAYTRPGLPLCGRTPPQYVSAPMCRVCQCQYSIIRAPRETRAQAACRHWPSKAGRFSEVPLMAWALVSVTRNGSWREEKIRSAPGAPAHPAAGCPVGGDLRVLPGHPRRHGVGGRAEDDRDAALVGAVEHRGEPVQLEPAARRLPGGPDRLADPDDARRRRRPMPERRNVAVPTVHGWALTGQAGRAVCAMCALTFGRLDAASASGHSDGRCSPAGSFLAALGAPILGP